jgi:EmrB/QacA subfamily drug resistance transporter
MLLLDTTIVNVAQVKIKDDLGASLTQIQWILDSYILAYAVLLLSFGRLGDVFGRKRLFMVGMALFTFASLLCAASAWIGDQLDVSGVNVLIAARVLQGIGGAFMMPQSLSLVSVTFPPEKRGAAMGMWGSVVAAGAILGPIVGGFIVTHYAWEWIFLINLPVGIASLYLIWRIVPESTDPLASGKIDWGGVLLSGLGIFALVYACIEGNQLGWTSVEILGAFAISAVLLTLFVWWETRVDDPIVKLELFRIRNFTVGNIIATIISFGMLGIFFPMTLFLQQALGYSPIKAGLTMAPMSAVLMVAAPVSGKLVDRIGPRWILFFGTTVMTIGLLYLRSLIHDDTTPRSLLPALLVTGAGMGFTFAPMTAAAMRDVPPRIAGSASGILNTMRNIGQVLGIAILGSWLQNRIGFYSEQELPRTDLDPGLVGHISRLAQQNLFIEIRDELPADLVGPVFDALRQAFVLAVHSTFLAASITCGVAALAALLIRNPTARTIEVGRPAGVPSQPAAGDR